MESFGGFWRVLESFGRVWQSFGDDQSWIMKIIIGVAGAEEGGGMPPGAGGAGPDRSR